MVARVPSRPQAELGRLGTRATLFWPDFKGDKNIHFYVKIQELEIDINSFQTNAAKTLEIHGPKARTKFCDTRRATDRLLGTVFWQNFV